MKRGEPLRRSSQLARSELKRDVEKVREFMHRGRAPLRSKPKPRPAEGPLSPAEWAERVFAASEGRCIITGAAARDASDRRFHRHHPFPQRVLRARGYHGRVWDPRNGVLLTRELHMQHELGAVWRVPWTKLPPSVWEFCRELDELEGTEWATQFVLRTHPIRAARGTSKRRSPDGEG